MGSDRAAFARGATQTEGRHRPRVDDRAALAGILFVLKTGIPLPMLPQEMECGSGSTCRRRLKEWHEAKV